LWGGGKNYKKVDKNKKPSGGPEGPGESSSPRKFFISSLVLQRGLKSATLQGNLAFLLLIP
jgi:hypothetical protein